MKTIPLILLSFALWCVALPPSAVQAQETVSFELFYDSLDPYGEWVDVDEYGYCWRPYAAMDDAMWRPYSDGYWAHTDGGWTWVSNEDFGWATYHYGRWARVIGLGWVWVPGYEWAPAWVSWRDTPDREYVGWAPLPPEARFEFSIGFNTWVDDYYDIGPSCYNFVRYRDFGEPRLRTVILPYERNLTIINHSVNITNISYRDSVVNNVYIGGPQYSFVREHSAREVRELKLRRRDDFDYDRMRRDPREYGRSINHREGDTFLVASPTIRRFRDDERREPAKVKERVKDVRVDRGWDGVKDPAVAKGIRDRMRQDADRTRPQTLPDKTPLGRRERDERIGATTEGRDQKTRDMQGREGRDTDREGKKPGAVPGSGRDDRVMPGGASQADIARRLEEEKKIREQRGGTAMDDRQKKRAEDDDKVGRPGGAPPDMADRREKERRDAIEAEQRRRTMEEGEADKKKEMAERMRREQGREEQMKVDGQKEKERQAAMDAKRRDDAARMQKDREMSERASKERLENDRRQAMESKSREQGEAQERMRIVEKEKQQRAAKEMQDRQRGAAEDAARMRREAESNQRRAVENTQRKGMEEARKRSDDSQREAAERSRRAADEARRQQMQSQQRRVEEPRPQPRPEPRPQPQPQVQRRPDGPPPAPAAREGGKPKGKDKEDDKEKEKGKR